MEEPLPLIDVSAFFLGVEEETVREATSLLQAFGGRAVDNCGAASHAIVPDRLAKSQWAKLRSQIKASCRERRPVLGVAWLNEVISGKVDPSDTEAVIRLTPPYVKEVTMEVVDGASVWAGRLRQRQGPGQPAAKPSAREPCTPAAASSAPAAKRRRTTKGPPPEEPQSPERQQPLVASLAETHELLAQESPAELEEARIAAALRRSLLDCALAPLGGETAGGAGASEAPEEVLGVRSGATAAEVRAAFREKALASHPDKGGDPQVFCRVKQAYLSLMASAKAGQAGAESRAASSDCGAGLPALAGPAHDFVLRDHKALVRAAFERDSVDLQAVVARQRSALGSLGLEPCECGSVVTNARGKAMRNQCFYLSLARSYLGAGSSKEDVAATALDLKRVVETAVLEAHPDWGGGRVGEHVQAFSDFLFFVLGSHPLLSEWSVAVFDETSGGVEIYTGSDFPGPEREEEQRSNLLTLWFTPGHYQALMPCRQRGAGAAEPRRPNPAELQRCLEEHGVACVPTQL